MRSHSEDRLRVGMVGYGVIGRRRQATLGQDRLVGVVDPGAEARRLATGRGLPCMDSAEELLERYEPDVVMVATPHHLLAPQAMLALEARCHVFVEKPGGVSAQELRELVARAESVGRWLWVGYNHRYHPGNERLIAEVRSGSHGKVMFVRARYGHGARVGYDTEWRANRNLSGGGELIDQGGHLLDLVHAILGPLPLSSALLRTAYWNMEVEDNAVLVLAEPVDSRGRWAVLQLSCTEWKNEFAVDVYCERARLTVEGLARSYGRQRLIIHRMRPEMGPPDTVLVAYPDDDISWRQEWLRFREALHGPFTVEAAASAVYAMEVIEQSYASCGGEPT